MSSLTANGLQNTGLPYKLTGGGNGLQFHEALGEVIREERLARKLTLREVSANGYVSMGHLSDVENGRKECSSVVIQNIANGIGVNSYDLIIEAGYRMAVGRLPETLDTRDTFLDQYQDLVG
tara:strand:- start:1296 stop:1661 length:366 start_codon:yes stop_codon:yes gene_type:complete